MYLINHYYGFVDAQIWRVQLHVSLINASTKPDPLQFCGISFIKLPVQIHHAVGKLLLIDAFPLSICIIWRVMNMQLLSLIHRYIELWLLVKQTTQVFFRIRLPPDQVFLCYSSHFICTKAWPWFNFILKWASFHRIWILMMQRKMTRMWKMDMMSYKSPNEEVKPLPKWTKPFITTYVWKPSRMWTLKLFLNNRIATRCNGELRQQYCGLQIPPVICSTEKCLSAHIKNLMALKNFNNFPPPIFFMFYCTLILPYNLFLGICNALSNFHFKTADYFMIQGWFFSVFFFSCITAKMFGPLFQGR